MSQDRYSTGVTAPLVVATRVVALYESVSGHIVHAHTVTTCAPRARARLAVTQLFGS